MHKLGQFDTNLMTFANVTETLLQFGGKQDRPARCHVVGNWDCSNSCEDNAFTDCCSCPIAGSVRIGRLPFHKTVMVSSALVFAAVSTSASRFQDQHPRCGRKHPATWAIQDGFPRTTNVFSPQVGFCWGDALKKHLHEKTFKCKDETHVIGHSWKSAAPQFC